MLAFLLIMPWGLLTLGAVAFYVVQRQNRRALDTTGATLQWIMQAVESTTDAIGIGDFNGNSLYHNRAHIALFGYRVDELNAVPGRGVLFADPRVAAAVHESIAAGRSWSGETDLLAKDGRRIPAAVRADVIRDETGVPVGIFGVFRDITIERRLAEDAARATKLDSLGMMAGGIAHDFNNLLTVILGQVYLLEGEKGVTASQKERIAEILLAAMRAKEVTDQLKVFAKGEVATKRLVDLEDVIRDAAKFAVVNTQVELRCELPARLPEVMADKAQMLQVLNNLAVNAVQAMPKGGSLRVAADVLRPDDAAAQGLRRSVWLRISVADTGVGIAPQNLERIFEPFFTTKPTGTGLGLATCYSIVKQHGGQLRVDSEVGAGTTFHLMLPVPESYAAV